MEEEPELGKAKVGLAPGWLALGLRHWCDGWQTSSEPCGGPQWLPAAYSGQPALPWGGYSGPEGGLQRVILSREPHRNPRALGVQSFHMLR